VPSSLLDGVDLFLRFLGVACAGRHELDTTTTIQLLPFALCWLGLRRSLLYLAASLRVLGQAIAWVEAFLGDYWAWPVHIAV
jgi:hypothetical protein